MLFVAATLGPLQKVTQMEYCDECNYAKLGYDRFFQSASRLCFWKNINRLVYNPIWWNPCIKTRIYCGPKELMGVFFFFWCGYFM